MARNSATSTRRKGTKAKTATVANTEVNKAAEKAVKKIETAAKEAIAGIKGATQEQAPKPKRRPNGSCKDGQWQWVCSS